MANDLADLVASLKADQQVKKSEKKEEEIISWMTEHWSWFAPSRRQFMSTKNQLGDVFPYSADGLCAALAVPDEVQLMKIPYADALKPMLDFKSTGLEEKFLERVAKVDSGQLALILVSGARSLVVTNMNVVWGPGITVVEYLPTQQTKEVGTMHIFQAVNGPAMLPSLFDNKEKYA